MKTEAEAGQCWCPMVRQLDDDGQAASNSVARSTDGTVSWNSCIGSRCAMWQWGEAPMKVVVDVPAYETNGDPVTHTEERGASRRGFCGLITTRGV